MAGKGGARSPETPAPKPAQPYTNPALRLDPALGLVVIEFHDGAGKLTSSIPNQHQIDAYRRHDKIPPSQTSPGQTAPAGPMARKVKDDPASAG